MQQNVQARTDSYSSHSVHQDRNKYLYAPSVSGIVNDSHITTFYGQLSQGTFSLWQFSEMETDFHSEEIGGTKEFPVDWQVYADHSDHQSFTKGLLIEKSGGSIHNCLRSLHNSLISVPDGGYVTGFDLSRTVATSHGHRFPNCVRFNMDTKNGKADIVVLSLNCRLNHNINVQVSMERKRDQQFVDGELKAGQKSLSTLQSRGSKQAALYLQLADENGVSVAFLQTRGCGDEEKSGPNRLVPSIWERSMAQRTHIFLKIAFMTFPMALARRKQNLLATTKAN